VSRPSSGLAGQNAGEFVPEALVLPEKEADFAPATPMSPAGTSVSGPMWRKSSLMKLWQNRMTSLSLFPFGRSPNRPCRPHRECRQGVLEDLLEGEELQDAEVDRRWKRSPPLYGPMALFIWILNPRLTR